MMKYLIMLIFMIPLSFKNFWLNQYFWFLMSFVYLLKYSFNWEYLNVSLFFGCDLLSYLMILLSFWICSLMILASENLFKSNNYFSLFLLVMVLLMISLYLSFSSMNIFIFYLFFEMSLIPLLFLILGWGYQPERIQASFYLLFYTLFGSLPLLLSLFYYYYLFYSMNFLNMGIINNIFLFWGMSLVFFIKMPMFMVHLWLPKAHVESPISGSMILAGIMLKLGGYGLMRLLPSFLMLLNKFNFMVISLSLMGGCVISVICIRQIDIKSLIAYSSVAHMGLVLGALMTANLWGLWGSLIMMIAHGLCSSGLFCLANITYERTHSRSIYLNKGMLNLMPSMSLWWFLFSIANMAAPPSLNLFGEIILINSLVSFSILSMITLMIMSFMGAAYSLYLYSFTQHGMIYRGLYSISLGQIREYILMFLHCFPLYIFIMKGDFIMIWI
uniref:NADH-ubiquinone oxidoreductase chain 4 n=1 Tax=Scirtidae sp. BMNH 1274304 TaxID=1796542 RepID=A0A126TF92_9COLE|nr:NADH dehydrogenase subunit 4 [Scirtidae sp. BMNH 1274304]